MYKQLHITHAVAVSAMVLAFSSSAHAAASRTFVATTGNDSNTATNCGATTPCRTFGAALGVTNSGGELVVLNSGGYGPATISQPVIITATGIDASISVTSGDGLTINTPGNVTLSGLNLYGESSGTIGIGVTNVGHLSLYNILIENFTQYGVNMMNSGNLEVYGSEMNDNAFTGINLAGTVSPVEAYVARSSFSHNGIGVSAGGNSKATVVDSSSQYSSTYGFYAIEGQMTLIGSSSAFNSDGMVSADGTFNFVNCKITNNVIAYSISSGGTMAGTNPGTSFIGPGQSTSGTLSTAVALQ